MSERRGITQCCAHFLHRFVNYKQAKNARVRLAPQCFRRTSCCKLLQNVRFVFSSATQETTRRPSSPPPNNAPPSTQSKADRPIDRPTLATRCYTRCQGYASDVNTRTRCFRSANIQHQNTTHNTHYSQVSCAAACSCRLRRRLRQVCCIHMRIWNALLQPTTHQQQSTYRRQ